MGITLKDIANSACGPLNQHLLQKQGKKAKAESKIGGRLVVKHFPKNSEEKNLIEIILIEWSQKRCLQLYEEYRFCVDRRWRFDYFLPDFKLAIEYEGIISEKSRHTSMKGYSNDCEKYRRASIEGIIVLRYTALNYRDLKKDLEGFKPVQHG